MRKKYIKVENIRLYLFSNAEFINFMERFMALLPIEKDEESQDAAPKLSITAEQLAEGKAYLATMKDLNKKSRMKAETKPKKEIDRLRDRMFSFIMERIKLFLDSPDAELKAAADKLYLVASPYKGAARLPYNQETEVLSGFLLDMNKSENLDAVTALGIEEDLNRLQSYNDQFIALVKEADMTESVLSFDEKMREQRNLMGDWYQEMADSAFATNFLSETEESLYFMSGLNALIKSVKKSYNQRTAKSGKDENPEEQPADDDKGDGGLEFVPVEKP